MRLKLFFIITLIFAGLLSAQEKQESVNWKGMSDEDAKRILGDMYAPKVFKAYGDSREIKESIINGNKITTIVFNYASICAPNRLSGTADLVWEGLGYGFEFGPLAAAEVTNDTGRVMQIASDSFIRTDQGDYSPDGTEKWGWLPKSGYVDTDQDEIARLNAPDDNGDGKPDSWPERWYSEGAQKYIWPAFLGDQATAPDEEVYFVVDDYTNREFPYYPFNNDSTKRGLGLDMEVRIIQFNNPLAEDILFLVYQITNASDKDLPEVYFGMHGDPHIGGSGNYSDDRAGFVNSEGETLQSSVIFPQRSRNMVYGWDPDGEGDGGRPSGYFGWKFLESPSVADDGEDNDVDGITDETPENAAGQYIDGVTLPLTTGISDPIVYTEVYGEPKARYEGDEDGDWAADRDDVGIDGIGPDSPNYPGPDYGEADGLPSQGWYQDMNGNAIYDEGEPISNTRSLGYIWAGSEPQFGLRDISESDQIGLTSFNAATYSNTSNVPLQDELMWDWLSAGKVDTAGQELLLKPGDNIFNFGTGPVLDFEAGETQRFSMCILFGNDLQDLILNAETSTRILEADYRFAQPPAKPVVKAVAGDGKVTLYWDTRAEESIDPLTGEQDFLGYKIYRSRDYTFSDVFTITDGRGNAFLGEAFIDSETGEIAQWHLELDPAVYIGGYHPLEYMGRAVRYYCGDPNYKDGLVHEWTDNSAINGIKYYYAVVAYDYGSITEGSELPPSETQAVIRQDPITGELQFDDNTIAVIPGPNGSGMLDAEAGNMGIPEKVAGNSTGDIYIKVMNDLLVQDEKLYSIQFDSDSTFSVLDSTGIETNIISKGEKFVFLGNEGVVANSVVVKDMGGNVISSDNYIVNSETGKIKQSETGSFPLGEEFSVSYRYFPVSESAVIDSGDANPDFDGMKIYVRNDILAIDQEETRFDDESGVYDSLAFVKDATVGSPVRYRADWEIRWKGTDTTATGEWANVGDNVLSLLSQPVACPFEIINTTPGLVEEPATYRINESMPEKRGNGKWDWGEAIIIQPQGEPGFQTSYDVAFVLPADSVESDPVLPADGDIFFVKTTKPFQAGDKYLFTTTSSKFEKTTAKDELDNIYVVPNPYVSFSIAEEPGRTSNLRGGKEVQFRNLPPECTIRIYTMTGELVETIEKNDNSSMASWDLLSFEGQRVAYGVYIYHVDVPGVGEKIGRLALIK